jgi:ABC-type transport system involved in multi-copper enzyme maturation permease subunit
MISRPLFKQSIKANWVLWLVVTLAMSLLACVMNFAISKVMGMENVEVSDETKGQFMQYAGALEYFNAMNGTSLTSEGFLAALMGMMGVDMTSLQSLKEIDTATMMNSMYYTLAGLMLPMIYVIITGNKLIAGQVDKGSMAYVLSTPTKRSSVALTQGLFLILSTFAMEAVCAAVDFGSSFILTEMSSTDISQKLILNLGSFLTIAAIGGICYLASCLFDLSKHSIAMGGGLSVFFYLCSVIGMFGTETFVNMGMGTSSLNILNKITILSLFDAEGICTIGTDAVSYDFVWKFAILFGIAALTYIIGARRFCKKDLPL